VRHWCGCTTAASARAQLAALAAAAFLILLIGRADEPLTRLFYDPERGGFPLRDAWVFSVLGHTVLKWAMLAFWLFCLVRGGNLRRGALYMALIAMAINLLKYHSPYSCPWDLPQFGGSEPHAGRCLPAAHPLVGFALFGLYPALRPASRRAARYAVITGGVVGAVAGAVQVARGAHFVSHVLWTAWLAWGVTFLLARLQGLGKEYRGPDDRGGD
jgi:membrane-associated PAP2 superfamily phosphatase